MPPAEISGGSDDVKSEVQDRVPDGNGKRDGENPDKVAQK
jgi:hypothetical protein